MAGFSSLPVELVALAKELEDNNGINQTKVGELEVIARVFGDKKYDVENVIKDIDVDKVVEKVNVGLLERFKRGRKDNTNTNGDDEDSDLWIESSRDVVIRKPRGAEKFRCSFAISDRFSNRECSDSIVNNILDKWLLQGFDVTIMAVGCENSGKTYTLFGDRLCVDEIYTGLNHNDIRESNSSASIFWTIMCNLLCGDKKDSLQVGLSYFDITSDNQVIDLLAKTDDDDDRKQKNNNSGKLCATYHVPNLQICNDLVTFARKQSKNWDNKTKQSVLNRSHSVVRISVLNENENYSSTLHIIDLAGKKDRKSHASPSRLLNQEKSNINKQLLGLERLLSEISHLEITKQSSSSLKSGRDSKLTETVGQLISGHKCFLIATLRTGIQYHAQNIATMRLATVASLINTACISNSFSKKLNLLKFEKPKVRNVNVYDKVAKKEKREHKQTKKTLAKEEEEEEEQITKETAKPQQEEETKKVPKKNQNEVKAFW